MSEFSNLGEQIKNTVQDAVDTMNFDHLNKNITDSVNSALYEVRNRLNLNKPNQDIRDWKVSGGNNQGQHGSYKNQQSNHRYYQTNTSYQQANTNYQQSNASNQTRGQSNAQANARMNAQSNADMWEERKRAAIERANQMRRNMNGHVRTNVNQNSNWSKPNNLPSVMNTKRLPGRVSGSLMKVTGYGLGAFFGVGGVISAANTLTDGLEMLPPAIACGIFFVSSLALGLAGKGRTSRVKRFKLYATYIGERKFVQLEKLADNFGYSLAYVKNDIVKMMQHGFFTHAHLDNSGTILILDDETYQQYLASSAEYQRRKIEEEHTKKQEQEAQEGLDPELRKTINEGKAYIRQIKEANDALPDVEISEKLSRLEQITSKIFSFVEEHPEQLSELRKFMEYYLPITLKLVNAYKDLDAQPVQGANISTSKKEIMKTLDTINFAFENLLDSLYQSTAMEVSSDISVLEALFAQDGLTKKDFDLK